MADKLADIEIAIEVHNESAAAKQELLLALGTYLPEDALVLTSCLATSATRRRRGRGDRSVSWASASAAGAG